MSGQAAARLLSWWARQPRVPAGYKVTTRRAEALAGACRYARRHAANAPRVRFHLTDCFEFAEDAVALVADPQPHISVRRTLQHAHAAVLRAATYYPKEFAEVLAKMGQRSIP